MSITEGELLLARTSRKNLEQNASASMRPHQTHLPNTTAQGLRHSRARPQQTATIGGAGPARAVQSMVCGDWAGAAGLEATLLVC